MKKKRVDKLLVERHLAENMDKAKRLVMAGLVYTKELRLDKPGIQVRGDIPLTVKGKAIPYVGRGGLKMEKALREFSISAAGKTMLDIGSSTGGFTDCALKNGLKLSYAIDVGYNQLDWRLRNDPRVVVMERTNFRHVTPEMLTEGVPSLAAADVSFISLTIILPVMKQLLAEGSDAVVLIKPQFEANREQVGEKGIVREKQIHRQVLEKIIGFAQAQSFELLGLTHSPITGGDGNIEFLAHLGWKKTEQTAGATVFIEETVETAHQELASN